MENTVLDTEQIDMIKWNLEVIEEVVKDNDHILSNDCLEDLQSSIKRIKNLLVMSN